MPVYKDKIRNTWYTSFYYTDWTGEKKRKKKEGFKTQREAKAYERDFLNKAHASCDMTFKNLTELYMEHNRTRLKQTTLNNKECIINFHLLPYFGNMPINAITITTIQKWQDKLLSSEANYKPTTLKLFNNELSIIFNFAVKYYKLSSNPVRECGSIGKNRADSIQFWTVEEFNKFIGVIDKPIHKLMFELLFWTGIRSGELMALTLNDFDIEAETVNINKTYTRLKKQDLITSPKTPKSKRIITIPPFLVEMLQEYVSKLYDYRPDERLFYVEITSLRYQMFRGSKKAKVKKIRIHDLRHSHASLLIELGFSPLLIAERLGHEKVETTLQTYSHLYPNKQGDVARKLQELNGDMSHK